MNMRDARTDIRSMNQPYPGKLLAIDYGRKRIGFARTDEMRTVCTPLSAVAIRSLREAVTKTLIQIQTCEPAEVVVGYPLLESGDPGELCTEIDEFIDRIQTEFSGPIHRVDESHTSTEIPDMTRKRPITYRKKRMIDDRAAVEILKRYLTEGALRRGNG